MDTAVVMKRSSTAHTDHAYWLHATDHWQQNVIKIGQSRHMYK